MRILHILNDVTDLGNGIVNAAVDLAAGLVKNGHVVAIASVGGGYEPLLKEIGVQHLYLDQTRRPVVLFKATLKLHRYIRDFRPDVVHVHNRTGLLLAWFWSKFLRYPLVAHVPNVHDRESLLMTLADRVIVVSESVGKTMEGMGIPKRKIRVVLNAPLESPRVPRLEDTPAVSVERPSIVTVCGMNHRKGIAELLTAFDDVAKHVPQVHLYLVGDGPEKEIFQQQANASAFRNRIHFEGYQSTPQSYMRVADIFVLASRRESFGLVLIEARQAGCAIVATDIDGIPEALDGGAAGLLVPPANSAALAAGLTRLLENPAERALWQQRARIGIGEFTYMAMTAKVLDVYSGLVHNGSVLDMQTTSLER
jgi:glycosyltransferase involved in cell wall biosynthesis